MTSAALSLGLEDGLKWATENHDDRRLLGQIGGSHSAEEVAGIVGAGSTPDGIDDVVAYWSGFSHGVAQYLREHLGLD
jgi:hypothetical protein